MIRPAALVPLALLAVPGAAAADDYSLHVLGNVQTSWTDNLFSAPDGATKETDLSTQLRPGTLLSYETPRTIFQLSYDLEASLYAEHTEAWSLNHLASIHGFFLTSPRTETQASASYAQGDMNSLLARPTTMQPPQQQLVGNGTNTFRSFEAGQSFAFGVTRELRLTQGARGRLFSSSDGSGNASGGSEIGLNGGVDRGWSRSALAVQVNGAFVTLDHGADSTHSVNASLIASFRRDLSQRWTALLDGGVAGVFPTGDENIFVQPTIGTNIGYTPRWGQAGLQLRRAMAPNLYTSENTITDSVNLNASLPLPWLTEDVNRPKLTTQGSIGVSRTRQIRDGGVTSATDIASADLSLQYNPRAGLGFALRAQHLRQIAEQMTTPSTDYDRTTVMLSMTYRFPDRLAAELPIRDSLRVDRSGNTPVGEEVAPQQAPGAP